MAFAVTLFYGYFTVSARFFSSLSFRHVDVSSVFLSTLWVEIKLSYIVAFWVKPETVIFLSSHQNWFGFHYVFHFYIAFRYFCLLSRISMREKIKTFAVSMPHSSSSISFYFSMSLNKNKGTRMWRRSIQFKSIAWHSREMRTKRIESTQSGAASAFLFIFPFLFSLSFMSFVCVH